MGYDGTGNLVLPMNMTVSKDFYLELLAELLEDCFSCCQSNMFQQDSSLANSDVGEFPKSALRTSKGS